MARRAGGILAVAVLVVLLGACGGSAVSSVPPDGRRPATLTDCRSSSSVRDHPVFAIGVSGEGRVCWEEALTTPRPNSHVGDQPLIFDGSAVLDADGVVTDVDLSDGHQRWRWSSGVPGTSGFGGGDGRVGAGQGRVVATRGTDPNQDLVGLDAATGAVRWTRPLSEQDRALGLADGTTATVHEDEATSVIDDGDGSLRWSTSPPAAPSTGSLYQVDGGPLLVAGQLIGGTQAGGVVATDAATGRPTWTRAPAGTEGTPDLATADGLVFVTTPQPGTGDPATTAAVEPSTGRTLWTTPTEGGANLTFVAYDGMLFAADIDQVVRLDPATGHRLWALPASVGYQLVGAGTTVAFVEDGGSMSSLVDVDAATGARRWTASLGTGSASSASQLADVSGPGGAVLVVVDGDRIVGYDPEGGQRRWAVDLPADTELDGAAAAPGGVVVQAYDDAYAIQGH